MIIPSYSIQDLTKNQYIPKYHIPMFIPSYSIQDLTKNQYIPKYHLPMVIPSYSIQVPYLQVKGYPK